MGAGAYLLYSGVMRAPNSAVLTALFFLGAIVFLSSMIALDRHVKENSHEFQPIKSAIEFARLYASRFRNDTNLIRGEANITGLALSVGMNFSRNMVQNAKLAYGAARPYFSHLTEALGKVRDVTERSEETDSAANFSFSSNGQRAIGPTAVPNDFVNTRLRHRHPAVPDPTTAPKDRRLALSCNRSFEPTCDMYNYVRFWNKRFKEIDCYKSPAQHPLGLNAPPTEAKYVVFQPDLVGV